MSHDPVTHLAAEMVRARLFGVDVQRPKRIDRQIDYFGSGGVRRAVVDADPRGESSLDAALSRFLRVILRVVKGAHGGRRRVIGF
jgi:hypothetical protein